MTYYLRYFTFTRVRIIIVVVFSKVEEHIEEITTRYESSDDECDSIVECLQSFNLNAAHRVHFPELGKDVVDGKFKLFFFFFILIVHLFLPTYTCVRVGRLGTYEL